jgi:membrane fusion protein (multidrug efflux system)
MGNKGSKDEFEVSQPGSRDEPLVARLCYVDDSRTSAYVVKRTLEPLGYQVDHFQSAEPAFVALIQGDYDLLLTDLKVSATGMDGDDLIHTIRKSGHPKISTLPIIVITGATDSDILVKVYDIGANQVMTKPVDGDELDGHIRRLLSERRLVENKEPSFDAAGSTVVSIASAKRVDKPMDNGPSTGSLGPGMPSSDDHIVPILQAVKGGPSENAAIGSADSKSSGEEEANTGESQPFSSAPQEDKASTLERAVDLSMPAKESIENDDDWAIGLMDEIVDSDDDEVVIIDPEEKSKKTRSGRVSGLPEDQDDILHEMNQHPIDDLDPEQAFIQPGESKAGAFFGSQTLRRGLGIVAVLLVTTLAGSGIYYKYIDKGIRVETIPVEAGEIFQSITMPGQVVSKQQLNISSSQAGRLVEVLVKEGEKVSKGQVLARLDDRELVSRLNRAKANLSNAREEIALAERTLQRLEKAYSKGAVAKRFVDDAEVELRSARTRAGIMVEEVRTATLDMEKQKIMAPFAGTVTARYVEMGQWVTPADSLFTLVDDKQREIELRLNMADSAAIEVGQTAFVSSDAFPDLKWKEAVIRIGTAAENDLKTNSIKVFVSLGDKAPELRFGQRVDAEIRTAWNPNAIKVPFEALITRGGEPMVAVLEEGAVKLRPVVTGIEDFSMAEIQQGLSVGEIAILTRGQDLKAGEKAYSISAVE